MGIGVPNVQEIWAWYRTMFGVDVRIFEEAAEAPLMTKYTGGVVHARTATQRQRAASFQCEGPPAMMRGGSPGESACPHAPRQFINWGYDGQG